MTKDERRLGMEQAIAGLLHYMVGPDWKDNPNFADTPRRVSRLYEEMLTPQINNWAVFPTTDPDLVLMRGHRVTALCPHHLLPVELRAYVAYIPHKKQLGLSKLARVVEEQLTRPIMQEDLGQAVAMAIHDRLEPKGVAVVLAGVHGCMRFRGVESDADTVTSVMKGVFRDVPAARAELFALIGRP